MGEVETLELGSETRGDVSTLLIDVEGVLEKLVVAGHASLELLDLVSQLVRLSSDQVQGGLHGLSLLHDLIGLGLQSLVGESELLDLLSQLLGEVLAGSQLLFLVSNTFNSSISK